MNADEIIETIKARIAELDTQVIALTKERARLAKMLDQPPPPPSALLDLPPRPGIMWPVGPSPGFIPAPPTPPGAFGEAVSPCDPLLRVAVDRNAA